MKSNNKLTYPRAIANHCSNLISKALEDEKEKIVPLAKIEDYMMEVIMEYCTYHYTTPPKIIPKPLTSASLKGVVDEFDFKFISTLNDDPLLRLFYISNYLDIRPLLELAAAQLAVMVKNKTFDRLKEIDQIKWLYNR